MPYPHLITRFCSASYAETVSQVANGMALAEPDQKVMRLVSWLFGVPIGEVKRDLRSTWAAQRQSEQNDRDPTGGRTRQKPGR